MIHRWYLNQRISYGHLHLIIHLIKLIVLIVITGQNHLKHFGNFHYMNGRFQMVRNSRAVSTTIIEKSEC